MAMIFPGMDPYLEDPIFWQGFHNRFVVHMADALFPLLGSRYAASAEQRVYIQGPEERHIYPDTYVQRTRPVGVERGVALLEMDQPIKVRVPAVEVRENYIEILDLEQNQKVVTIIEALSPTNKWPGTGRTEYLKKQLEIRRSDCHLVEIDLLRTGHHTLAVDEYVAQSAAPYQYLASVNRATGTRADFELYPRMLPQRLPRLRVPLAESDPDVRLDLQEVLSHTYEVGKYISRLRYEAPCRPPLSPEDQTWADELLRAAGIKQPDKSPPVT